MRQTSTAEAGKASRVVPNKQRDSLGTTIASGVRAPAYSRIEIAQRWRTVIKLQCNAVITNSVLALCGLSGDLGGKPRTIHLRRRTQMNIPSSLVFPTSHTTIYERFQAFKLDSTSPM